MALYNKDSKLAGAIVDYPQLIPVVNRFGISLGVGDVSIGTICAQAHVDPDFFLSVVNTFLDKDYFPANPRGTFTLEKTVEYLQKTSNYYLMVQLPNIERHFISLLGRSGENNNLGLLGKFFNSVKAQFDGCYEYDANVLFPALKNGCVPEDMSRSFDGHADMEDKLHDLLYFFVVHLQGDYDRNLCVAVVTALSSLDNDYRQNNRIRNRILLPLISEIKASGKRD